MKKLFYAFTHIFIAIKNLLRLRCQFLKIGIFLLGNNTLIRTKLQSASAHGPYQC